ncbi:uncharacterized protein A1O9_03657, partial [Exophiala aquamarina CBS 119918]
CLRTNIQRTTQIHAAQIRMLWWWSRQPIEWQPWCDADQQERVRRHHRLMRHKYAKAWRRKAMWERDDSQPWSWRSARWLINNRCYERPISATSPPQPPVDKEQEDPLARRSDPHYNLSFRAFVDYIDREVARDPYGVLFGKHLESPPSTNNSSWTSFSWMFESKARDAKEPIYNTSQEPLSSQPGASSNERIPINSHPITPPSKISVPGSKPDAVEEYEYDPITMRNVPKTKNTEFLPKQPFLQSLFSEHGVDIPVKIYQPHKVFGYSSKASSRASSQVEVSQGPKAQLESSTKSEISSLMARTKGNSINTTAQFTDVSPDQEVEALTADSVAKTRSQQSAEPDDHAPLFSGTTYAARSFSPDSASTPTSDWLSKEGFRTAGESTTNEKQIDDNVVKISDQKVESKLEPALDRMRVAAAESGTSSDSVRLEPSIDRHAGKASEGRRTRLEATRGATMLDWESEDDVDLLRASDVRAGTRSARVSKQQLEKSKRKTRFELESNFAKNQANSNEADNLDENNKAAGQISKGLASIWNHIKEYPSGIVSRTMQSMNTFNDDYKKYVKPSSASNLTEKLVFKGENLSKTPSIYRATTKHNTDTLPTSPDVEKEEKERSSRIERLRAATEEMKKDNEVINAQLSRLAADIKVIYEEECGPIGTQPTSTSGDSVVRRHKQKAAVDTSEDWDVEDTQSEKAIQEAEAELHTMKNGFQDTEAEHGKSAKLRAVMDGTKELRRELHETGMAIRAIESGRPQTVWNTPTASSTNFGKKRMELTDRRATVKKSEEDNGERIQLNLNEHEPTKPTLSGPPKEELPQEVPGPVFTPSQSPIWNDEQPPPIEDLKEKSAESTYVVLAQDGSTGKIEMSPLNNVPMSSDKAVSPILVLSKLHRASDYLVHFERLERSGYELYTGSKNMLIFRKQHPGEVREASPLSTDSSSAPSNSLAVDSVSPPKQTATVLDELPSEVDPSPGSAAPAAAPNQPAKQPEQHMLKSRVRRQEQVFSGTMRPGEDPTRESNHEESFAPTEPGAALWEKFTLSVKRAVLIAVALGGVAYAIGFVAEGIGAQTQIQNGMGNGQVQGPRKRIVMTGQRPGIYSTESSR